jgi:nucleotide-binding universal stress UspA family protein
MYKRIFLPTDGSKLSGKAVKAGIALAQSLDASVTIFHVYPEFRYLVDEGYLMPGTEEIRQRYEAQARQHTAKILVAAEKLAKNAGVPCSSITVSGDRVYEEIIAASKKKKCDLIVMASHGRKGLSSLLLGSETAKVLTHSAIPVLVVR